MKQKALLGVVGLTLVIAFAFGAYWLGRTSATPSGAPATPSPVDAGKAIDVEPSLQIGAQVEALSAEGWQAASIQAVEGSEAIVRYQRESLGEERIDLRLLRRPERELTAKPVAAPERSPAATDVPPPSAANPSTPAAPALGPRSPSSAASVAVGTYDCDLDTRGIVSGATGTFADDEAQQWQLTLELEILSDRDYGAFGQDAGRYTFDVATSRIVWEDGVLAGQPAQYQAESGTIVSSMGGQALTCTLRR